LKVRNKKLRQTWTLALGLLFACTELGWLFWTKSAERDQNTTLTCVSQVILLIYLLVVSILSISSIDIPVHWSYLIHCSTLSAIGFFPLAIAQILPVGPRFNASSIGSADMENAFRWLVILSLGTATCISSTIPRAPRLHFPPELVYQASTLGTSAPKSRDNVIGEPHASIASFLLFSYVTPVVMLGYHAQSIEIKDLPILTARLRSPLIFSKMRNVVRNVKLPTWWHIEPGCALTFKGDLKVLTSLSGRATN
jgi:hypothetical protein